MFQLDNDDNRKAILSCDSPLLIQGGPGSGKTTIALHKAKKIVEDHKLQNGQKVLFLSFARATISRVEEQANELISKSVKEQIEVNTYHGFFWNMIKYHGYLMIQKQIHLIPPYKEAIIYARKTKEELFTQQGLVCFDMFAGLCTKLLSYSQSLLSILQDTYPFIIVDEFQDTNSDEWNFIQLLGEKSVIITLADQNQRMYGYRGANPERINQFIQIFNPLVIDFKQENHRSCGTDIIQFGNDLILSQNYQKQYRNVKIVKYNPHVPPQHIYAKLKLLQVMEYLKKSGVNDWSIAILVPTNKLMLEVSNLLAKEQKSSKTVLPRISHEVSIDLTGSSLAACVIAFLLDVGSEKICTKEKIIMEMYDYILGNKANEKDVKFAEAIKQYVQTGIVRGSRRQLFIDDCKKISDEINGIVFSGDVILDWKKVLQLIQGYSSEYLKKLSDDAQYIRLLQRGSQFHSALDRIWREKNSYCGAVDAINHSLAYEHLALSNKKWTGINIMTIHKSKGKEFDAVIVYEGFYRDRYISQYGNEPKAEKENQARINLRVAVTRAKRCAFIFTPSDKPCPLL